MNQHTLGQLLCSMKGDAPCLRHYASAKLKKSVELNSTNCYPVEIFYHDKAEY